MSNTTRQMRDRLVQELLELPIDTIHKLHEVWGDVDAVNLHYIPSNADEEFLSALKDDPTGEQYKLDLIEELISDLDASDIQYALQDVIASERAHYAASLMMYAIDYPKKDPSLEDPSQLQQEYLTQIYDIDPTNPQPRDDADPMRGEAIIPEPIPTPSSIPDFASLSPETRISYRKQMLKDIEDVTTVSRNFVQSYKEKNPEVDTSKLNVLPGLYMIEVLRNALTVTGNIEALDRFDKDSLWSGTMRHHIKHIKRQMELYLDDQELYLVWYAIVQLGQVPYINAAQIEEAYKVSPRVPELRENWSKWYQEYLQDYGDYQMPEDVMSVQPTEEFNKIYEDFIQRLKNPGTPEQK